MKFVIEVLFVVLVVQASAQNNPSLRCFECADCRTVERGITPLVECYSPATVPTRPTNPGTIGLTPTVPTTSGLPASTTTAASTPVSADGFVDISSARNAQIFTCFVVQSDIGNRRVISRGCGIMSASKDQTCRDYNQNEEPGACNLCNEHECNDFSGVTKPFASILSIFVAVIVALKMH